jgi:hypothetical protein
MGRGQGDHVGTGQPIAFVCPVLRRAKFAEDRTAGDYDWHRPTRTGRARVARTRGAYTRAVGRMLDTEHEYRCRCGHVGWSKHADILRYPIEGPA